MMRIRVELVTHIIHVFRRRMRRKYRKESSLKR